MRTTPAPDGTSIAWEVGGEGPPLVLVHGITESSASWDPLVAPLEADHRLLRVDLRGHGASQRRAPYDLATFAVDVRQVMTMAGIGDDALLVGHSLGGTVVTAFAAAFGCRAVVNVDQPLDLAGFQAGLQQLAPMLRGDEATFRQAVEMVFESMRGELDGAEAGRIEGIRHPEQDVVLGVWDLVIDTPAADLDALVRSVAAGVTVPYLSLHGIDPGPGYPGWLHERIPSATVVVWAGTGHYPHLVHPERFLAEVARFESSLPG